MSPLQVRPIGGTSHSPGLPRQRLQRYLRRFSWSQSPGQQQKPQRRQRKDHPDDLRRDLRKAVKAINNNILPANSGAVSDITVSDVAAYLRIPELSASDQSLLSQILEAAKAYVMKYTGLDAAGMDQCPDIVMVVYILCQDMYDNRTLYAAGSNVSSVVETILSMHSINLLPSV